MRSRVSSPVLVARLLLRWIMPVRPSLLCERLRSYSVELVAIESASNMSSLSPRLHSERLRAVSFVLLSSASASDAVSEALLPFQTVEPISSSVWVRLSLSATSCSTFSRTLSLAYMRLVMLH
jgi:hypothetical protein